MKSRSGAIDQTFLRDERLEHTVVPPEADIFSAFHLTRFADTRVVILGQDPHHLSCTCR